MKLIAFTKIIYQRNVYTYKIYIPPKHFFITQISITHLYKNIHENIIITYAQNNNFFLMNLHHVWQKL